MAIVTILPRTAGASVSINSVEYNQFMSFASVQANAPEIDETVFSTENVGGTSSVGTERLTVNMRGIMKRGAAGAGPLMPLSSYQGVPFVVAWDSGCQVSGTLNLTQATAARAAGSTGTIDGQGYSTGAYVKSWNTTS